MCEQQNQMESVLRKSKPRFSSRIKRNPRFGGGYCKGKGPRSYIGPWTLSEDVNKSEDKQIIMKYSQTKFHK